MGLAELGQPLQYRCDYMAMLWQGYASVNPAAPHLSYLTLRSHQAQAALIDVGDFDDR
ncbi:hypothetical protein [Serratia fonticola]|uniref:hypothetical protein n=1 Tax=Serratia fonticola TaxID=47917 RepID=UPI003AFFB91D